MKTCMPKPSVIAAGLLAAFPLCAANVTFSVNMSVQTTMGRFDPATDSVVVSGGFNNWSTSAGLLAQNPSEPAIYEGTFDAGAVGSWPNYKFIKNRVIGGTQWEDDGVGAGGSKNRWFQIASDPQVLDVVYFNNITNVAVNVTPVTFQVNMSVQIAQGLFDPVYGNLTVGGAPLNDWSRTASPLTQSATDTNLWVGTFSITNPVGGTVSYKYLMNDVWETIPNRSFVLASGAQTLPPVYYNNMTNVAAPIPLTFEVNLGVQMARGNFNPANGEVVEVRGSFLTDSGGNWLGGFSLTNDPANAIIYRGTWLDTNDTSGSVIQYQFVLNYGTWETTGNRNFTIPSTNATTVPLAFFNNVADLGAVTLGPIAAGQASLSWTAGPFIWLQRADSLAGLWQDMDGTQGQSSASVSVGPGNRYFRLRGP